MDRTGALFHSKITTQHLKPIHHPIDFDTNSLEVKSILDHRGVGPNREYLVSWKGLESAEDSWEPVSHFDDVRIIDEYHLPSHSPGLNSARKSRRVPKPRQLLDA